MPRNASQKKLAGRIKVQVDLPGLPPTKFYAGIKKKTGPKRKPLAEALQTVSHRKPVQNPYRSYTVSYKLRVLSYWYKPSIPCGPTKLREPTSEEVANYFKIPVRNLSRWKKEEMEGKYATQTREQRRAVGGGRQRRWAEMERELFSQFRERRALGRPVRRGWFRRVSKELFAKLYPKKKSQEFLCSHGWFRNFLRGCVTIGGTQNCAIMIRGRVLSAGIVIPSVTKYFRRRYSSGRTSYLFQRERNRGLNPLRETTIRSARCG